MVRIDNRNCLANLRYSLSTNTVKIRTIQECVVSDPDLREAYRSNIAMSFYDNYRHYVSMYGNRLSASDVDIHKVANASADYFINIWTTVYI